MKAYVGVDVFLISAVGGGQHHAPAILPREKSPWNPLDRRLGEPPE
jgi:hypothetical protein